MHQNAIPGHIMAGSKRGRSSSKMWIPLPFLSIILLLLRFSENNANICSFCRCNSDKIRCSGVFWKGTRLRRTLQDEALSHLNIGVPPSNITRDIFRGLESSRFLDLSRNGLFDLDDSLFINFTNLNKLDLSQNHFADLPDLLGLDALNILLLNENVLQELPMHLRWTAPVVRILRLNSNRLKTVTGIHLPQTLTTIDLSKNLISIIDSNTFKGLVCLEFVYLENNRISEVGHQALLSPVLVIVILTGNDIRLISPGAFSESATTLHLPCVSGLDLSDFTTHHLQISRPTDRNRKKCICPNSYFSKPTRLNHLRMYTQCNFELIPNILAHCPLLRHLSVNWGILKTVNLTHHSHLENLYLFQNSMREILNLSSLTVLNSLWLNNNLLTSVPDLSHLNKLTFINLSQNKISFISAFDFNDLKQLKSLSVSGNQITLITGIFQLSNLNAVDLSVNLIEHFDKKLFSSLKMIKRIHINENKLTARSTKIVAPRVTELHFHDNEIATITSETFRIMFDLEILMLQNNRISIILLFPFLPNLSRLNLDNNPLSFIANDTFLSTPNLEFLSLSKTGLTSLPATTGTLTRLKRIDLNGNYLSRFPTDIISDLPKLADIVMQDNQIDAIDLLSELRYHNHHYFNVLGNPVRAFNVRHLHLVNLNTLLLGFQGTEFVSESMIGFIQRVTDVTFTGSPTLRIPSRVFCNANKRSIVFTGVTICYVNGTCNVSSRLRVEFADVVTTSAVIQLLLSHVDTVSFSNITLLREHNEVHPTYCTNLIYLKYVLSGLLDIPTLFAPDMIDLDMTDNLLNTLRLGILFKYYPDLHRLDVSNNRIRVLSSCGVSGVHHPLRRLILDNNDLGRFSSWKCGNGFRVMLELVDLHLFQNNISFLSKELIPSSMSEKGRYGVTVHAGNNPIVCSCPQRWLLDADVMIKGGECAGPPGHVGRDLQDLLHEGFPCAPSLSTSDTFCSTTMSTKSTAIAIRCPVESFPHPHITWFLRDAGTFIALDVTPGSNLTSENDYETDESQQLDIEIDNDAMDEPESNLTLLCQAVNDFGTKDFLIEVHVIWDVHGESGSTSNISVTCDAYQNEEHLDTNISTDLKTTPYSPLEHCKDGGHTSSFSPGPYFFRALSVLVIFSCIIHLL